MFVHQATTPDSTSTIYIKHPQTSQYSYYAHKCWNIINPSVFMKREICTYNITEWILFYNWKLQKPVYFAHKHVTKAILFSVFILTVIEILLEIAYNKNISDKLKE